MIALFGKLATIAVATFALVSCGPIDACLDAGGQWDYERRVCFDRLDRILPILHRSKDHTVDRPRTSQFS